MSRTKSLSILIPARNEMFLNATISSILSNIEADTEIIVVLDGSWPAEHIPDHPRVTLIHHSISIGQRAATNEAARIACGKYLMKLDAHCALDKGFDLKLLSLIEPNWTVIPRMYNLHAFNWYCNSCGNETYQGPTPTHCKKCAKDSTFTRIMLWQPRPHTRSDSMCFDRNLHFQYFREYSHRPEVRRQRTLSDSMSLLGACWLMSRDRYRELDGLDEAHGSWGQMGTEIACKTWLSGGRLVCNKTTWFAHLFRTQGGDFGMPYPHRQSETEKARTYSRDLWLNNKWPKAIYDIPWLVNKFSPVPGW